MKRNPQPLSASHRLLPTTRVVDVADSPLLDVLTPVQLVIYLRLVAMSRRGPTVAPRNQDLHPNLRVAIDSLRALAGHQLIKLSYSQGTRGSREITVAR